MAGYTHEERCRLWLQSAPSLTWRGKEKLLEAFGSASEIHGHMNDAVRKLCGDKAWRELVKMKSQGFEKLERQLRDADAYMVFRGGEGYPALLNEISDPPQALFVRGMCALDEKSVAIVGSRHDTRYGRTQAFNIARDLAREGVTIVSGLARGIDAAAHEGALAGGGRTVGVLGCGIDRIYPESNKELGESILQNGGAIISEFPLGTEPRPYHFPIRNRIISGMSAALLLIEGGEKSGTLITAGYAADQGREVYALPGNVDAPGSAAPLKLLREGAGLCTCAQDILEDMRWVQLHAQRESAQPEEILAGLSGIQQKIAAYMLREPRRFEELVDELGVSPDALTAELTLMELDGVIEARAGRVYALRRELFLF